MNFKINDIVLVKILNETDKEVYTSRIIKVRGNEIAIATLQRNLKSLALNFNESLQVTVIKHDAVYEFITRITYQGYSYFLVPVPETVIRKQRRYEVRVPVKFPVEVLYSYRDGIPVAAYLSNCVDLSAGGIKILTPVQYQPNTFLRLILNVPENGESYLSALVIRSGQFERQEFGNLYPAWAALKFQQLSEPQRKKIRNFIYRWQELRVKSLI